ncbi:hypothetical protein H0H87_003614 [Tephrocybe sp. NHM501043]|nr:hypothetical protein H0H87_003614 [Tephrocybe sp. NHM501043]
MLQAFHPLSAMATGQQTPSQLASGVSAVPVIPSPEVNTAGTTGNAATLQAPAMLGNTVVPIVTSAVPRSRPALTPATLNAPTRSVPSSNVSSTPMPSSVSVSAANQVPVETNTAAGATPASVTFVPAAAASKENDSWEMAKSALDTTLNLLLQSSDAFPPLKSVISGLVGVINLFKSAAENREDYSQLESELGNLVATLKHYGQLNPKEPDGSVTHTLLHIQEEVTEIKKIQSHGRTRQLIEATKDKDDIIKRYRTIQSLIQQLQTNILFQSLDHTKEVKQITLLATLSPVHDAHYNSSYSETVKRHRCTPQTREGILADLKAWVNNPGSSKVYWLNGMAGTGKTTIMYNACQKAHAIVPSIAFQLAGYSSAFRSSLCGVIEQEPHTISSNVETQFSKLVVQPMKAVQNNMPPGVVIVIDALDECENGPLAELLLQTLLKFASQLPVKFFVTSRPEPSIQHNMLGTNGYSPSVLHLHDIEQSLVEADIQIYLLDMFANVNPPFFRDEIFQLTKLAGKLFVFASTAARYINPGVYGVNPHSRLKTMLKMASTPTPEAGTKKPYKDLDELYRNILAAAFNYELEDDETQIMKLVLRTVICAKEPMAADTMASFLDITVKELKACLGPLQSAAVQHL